MSRSNKFNIQVFGDNKRLNILKVLALSFMALLFVWFTFDMTGLKIGDTLLVRSAFQGEIIDFVFYLIYLGTIVFYVVKEKIGKYVVTAFLSLWGLVQLSNFFKSDEGLLAYNETFADTHHFIAPSTDHIVKDTYHIILDALILLAFLFAIIYLILSIINDQKLKITHNNKGNSNA